MKILIIRFSSIGDILLTTPFIRQVRTKFPKAQIDYVVKQKFSEIIKDNPHIDNYYVLDDLNNNQSLKDLLSSLQKKQYDYIFDLHNNFRSNFLRRKIRSVKKHKISKDKINQLILVYLKINRYGSIKTIPERYLAVGHPAGIQDDNEGLELYWQKISEDELLNTIQNEGIDLQKPSIGIAPGAGFFTKRWPLNYFTDLIDRIVENNYNVILIGGKSDNDMAEHLSGSSNVFNLVNHLSILESGIVISRMKALISNDSGMMHMATAVKTPVVAIFGSTVREFGFFPYRSSNIVLENSVECRPCSHIGRNKCPKVHFKCMQNILPGNVYDALMQLV